MNHKNYMKLSVILPVIIGVIVGGALFWIGEAEDAPGLCLIGVVIAFLLIMWGVYNAGAVKKNQLAYILPLCFGAGSLVMSIVLQFDGELEELPGMFPIGILIGLILVGIGVVKIAKSWQKNLRLRK